MIRRKVLAVKCVFMAVLLTLSAVAQTNSTTHRSVTETSNKGSICVLPNSPEPPTRISDGGEYNPNTLTVRVDGLQPIRWPHEDPVLIENLDLQLRHIVVLTSDGKRIQSFRFKFSPDDNAKVCIYFDGYQGVQLGNRTDALWCKAKQQKCWR